MNEKHKPLDCVEMKRQIQEQIYQDTRDIWTLAFLRC